MCPDRITTIITQFTSISLDETNRRAALQTRADNKYFLPWQTFVDFMGTLRDTYVMLEIEGQRVFTYDTQYFDTVALTSYWGHVQGRRKRFKCRSRHYVDSGLCYFELKLKGGRGQTVKYKMAYSEAEWGEVSPTAASFLQDCLDRAYGMVLTQTLAPTLRTQYQRVTLTAQDSTERVTCDFNLTFAADGCWQGQMAPDHVLVETKSERGRGRADQTLWRMGARPTAGSKYCLGLSLVRPDLRSNPFQKVRKRYFIRETVPQMDRLSPWPVAVASVPLVGDTLTPAHAPLPSAAAVLFE